MDWGKWGTARTGFLDVRFIQIVRSLNYCSGLSSLAFLVFEITGET